jgi:hypothetical protein
MRKTLLTIQLFIISYTITIAQHQEVLSKPELWKGKQKQTQDTNSLLHAFKAGQMHGHFRYFFMATDNAKGLTDYYANAVGGGIKYETLPFKGFQFGVSGFFVYNIGSSDLAEPDEKTNQPNRYEIGLFDITDPHNKNNIDRLEELYLKYNWKQSHITFGKQLINTPFINLQDGRMRPTEVGGVYAEINDLKNTKVEGGWLYEISPRSTVEWYGIGESIGVYPQGVASDGVRSEYANNLESKGLGLLTLSQKITPNISLKFHNLFVENIFNTFLLQTDYQLPLTNKSKVIAGLQYVQQNALNNGGNEDASKAYIDKGSKAYTFGARVGWENKRWQTSLNYNRITAHSRYLMPREWGRDPFYTFMPRERNEGLGDVQAVVLKTGYQFLQPHIKLNASFGFFTLPDVNNFKLNKYGLPSYNQLNIDIRHDFEGFFKGLEAQLLLVYKKNTGNTYNNDRFVINKVDMMLWNFVLNYHF